MKDFCFSDFSCEDQRPRQGRSAYARFLPDEKSGKESLRAFPPKDLPGVRGWACVKSRFGPSPLLWLLVLPPHQATLGSWPYGWVVSMSGPTLEKRRSRRRKPGHRPLGTAAHQDKALAVEGSTSRGVGGNHRTESHLCDMNQSRAEQRRTHPPPSTAGWIPQGGGRPRLWWSLVPFWQQKGTPSGERPHQAGKPETVRLDGQSLRPGGREREKGGSTCFPLYALKINLCPADHPYKPPPALVGGGSTADRHTDVPVPPGTNRSGPSAAFAQ